MGTADDFDEHHESAWGKLYGLVAETMREGARGGTWRGRSALRGRR